MLKIENNDEQMRVSSAHCDFCGQKRDINTERAGMPMEIVGRIDNEIFHCITEDLVTDEVIVTEERIEHIRERHPGDYALFSARIGEILEHPDYILEANKPNTVVLLKEIPETGERCMVILRIRAESDPTDYLNSVLSFWSIGETTWGKNVRNKKTLYKRE